MAKKKQDSNIPTSTALQSASLVPPVIPASGVTAAPTARMTSFLGLFAPTQEALDKARSGHIRRLTLPPIIKPASVGPGTGFQGKILRIIKSPKSQYRSMLLVMEHPKAGEFCWPANAVTCGALATYLGLSREALDLEKPAIQAKLAGITLLVEGLGPGTPRDGKRAVNLYNIACYAD